jgi:transcriptional regulator with XRE-family HTH domain
VTRAKKERKYNKLFGPHVRKARQERFPGITAGEFAESVGITGSYLSNIENCKVPPPSDTVVKAIAAKLEEDPDVLLAMAGYIDPEIAANIGHIKESQYDILKMIKFARTVMTGSSKFTTEQFVAYLLGRTLEEHRKLKTSELLPEVVELFGYLASHDEQFSEELQPTVDRGLRVLGPVLEQIEAQMAEEAEKKANAKKAKRR